MLEVGRQVARLVTARTPAGTRRSRVVRGPRPSRPRIAAASASTARPPPAPRSPEFSPTAANRTTCPVGPMPEAVRPGTAHDHDAPRAVAARPQRRVGVVEDDPVVGDRPRLRAPGRAGGRRCAGRPRPGCRPRARGRPARPRLTGLDERPVDASLESVEPRLEPDRLVRDRRAPDGRQQRPVGGHQRDVGLRVATVDGEDRGQPGGHARAGSSAPVIGPRVRGHGCARHRSQSTRGRQVDLDPDLDRRSDGPRSPDRRRLGRERHGPIRPEPADRRRPARQVEGGPDRSSGRGW